MGRKPDAVRVYRWYFKKVQQGEKAKYVYPSLVQWGYMSG